MEAAVAAICVEAGYLSANRDAVDTLTQVLKCYITEIGKASNTYCEVAQRTIPTVSDVHLALIDMGSKLSELEEYAHRQQRRHLPRQLKTYPQPQGRMLQVGTRKSLPSHVPPNLPNYPDNHTFLKTPTYSVPHTDYRAVREKLALQNSASRKSLSLLLARIGPSVSVTGEDVPNEKPEFKVCLPNTSEGPAFLSGLIPPTAKEENKEPS